MKQSLFLINFPRQYDHGYTQAEAMDFARKNHFSGVEATNLRNYLRPISPLQNGCAAQRKSAIWRSCVCPWAFALNAKTGANRWRC